MEEHAMPRRHVAPRDAVAAVLALGTATTGGLEAPGPLDAERLQPDSGRAAGERGDATASAVFVKRHSMGTCDECGSPYDDCFTIERNAETHVFDSFECAVRHLLAPVCAHCGCRI